MSTQQVAGGVTVTVSEVRTETASAKTIVLADDLPWRAGHFVTVRIPVEPESIARSYSLCNGPGEPLAFTVKRVDGGRGSNWLCDHVRPGDQLLVLPPAGAFGLEAVPHPVILCAAGSGITPLMAMAREILANRDDPVRVLYANRDEESVIFARAIADMTRSHPDRLTVTHWLESLLGLPDPLRLRRIFHDWIGDDDVRAYLCGPGPFMDAAAEALAGLLPDRHVHREVFSSLTGDPFHAVEAIATDGVPTVPLTVDLDGDRSELDWPVGQRLLDTLLAAGLDAPFSCREGRCSACICQLREGRVTMVDNHILDEEDLAEGMVLACQSLPESDTEGVVVTYDEQ